MISSIELLSLALEGNLDSNTYGVIPAKRKTVRGHEVSFEYKLRDLVYATTDFEDLRVCVGTLPCSGEVGYVIKKVREIPTAHNPLGAADAIYEVDGTNDEEGCRYYAVWVITN